MDVVLAGYNIDSALIDEAVRLGIPREQLTPETLSAAYARISRDPKPVNELRAEARAEVQKARASNERIVFGLGHASVAEHAVFNFDLMGLSRLAIEAVEHSRLCSYTEKSQRYIRLDDDHVLPKEIIAVGREAQFERLVQLQNRTYQKLYRALLDLHTSQRPTDAANKQGLRTLEGLAKEDARYVTSLATFGQLGMTINARCLEQMIRRLSSHPLDEVRAVGAALRTSAESVASSLVRYLDPDPGHERSAAALKRMAKKLFGSGEQRTLPGATGAVQLCDVTPEADLQVTAALLENASTEPWNTCFARAQEMSDAERGAVIMTSLSGMRVHDPAPRAFEHVSCQFDLVLSAAAFAQLKRHRMSSWTVQPYDPAHGYTVPEAVQQCGQAEALRAVVAESTRLYEALEPSCGSAAAAYALTQAHRRRVLIRMNARELYHFARLRQDAHAQWDIRQLADRMLYLARQHMPLTLMLACGKDRFDAERQRLFA